MTVQLSLQIILKKYCTTKNGFYFGRKHMYIAEYNEFNKRIIRNYDKIRSCMFYDLCKRHEVETTDKWYMDFLVDNELYVKIVFFIDIYELGYLSGLIRENSKCKDTMYFVCFPEDEKYLEYLIPDCQIITFERSTIEEYLEKDYIEYNGYRIECPSE